MEHPAKKIKFIIKTNSLTVNELSRKLGITSEVLRDILDEREMPTPHLLFRICNLFDLKDDYFGESLRPGRQAAAAPAPASQETSSLQDQLNGLDLFSQRVAPGSGSRAGGSSLGGGSSAPHGRSARGKTGRRKIDLAEIAARQQALLDLLISKNVFSRDEYATRLEILRAKIIARRTERQR